MLKPSLKILILCSYFNRPILIKNALNSILKQEYKIWHLAFCDDNSNIPGEPIVRDILRDHLNQVSFHNTYQSIENKIENGLIVGKLANEFINNNDYDIGITLCDDDCLFPDYLQKINAYFLRNKNVQYCWSNIHLYNPLLEKLENVNNLSGIYNEIKGPVEPYGRLDGSQVAFRIKAIKENNIWYRDTTKSIQKDKDDKPFIYSLDGELFKSFYKHFGPCPYTGFVSQYKGVHEQQLVFLKEHVWKTKQDVLNYLKGIHDGNS